MEAERLQIMSARGLGSITPDNWNLQQRAVTIVGRFLCTGGPGRVERYSVAADRNKEPILEAARDCFERVNLVLEIGSGTGQHAEFFAEAFPRLHWLPSEIPPYLNTLKARFEAHPAPNIVAPVLLDVRHLPWNLGQARSVDMIYSANCLHIMSWESVHCLFAGIAEVLGLHGYLLLYGPFKYGGQFTTPSNAAFDLWLKRRDSASGVRDFEAVDALAATVGLSLLRDTPMPANNQCLIWQRSGPQPNRG